MLIDDHSPAGEPLIPAWSPPWRVIRWALAAVVIGIAGASAGDAIGTILVMVALAAGCRALDLTLPYREGLREWKQ